MTNSIDGCQPLGEHRRNDMSAAPKSTKHSAPGPYLGFALQPVRLCYHLLTCAKGAKVSLEHLDDVAIHNPDGSICLEQTKSALKQNPLSDWAVDLWKALSNWLEALDSGAVQSGKTRFRLYVTPRRAGALARALNDATSVAEVSAIAKMVAQRAAKAKQPLGCSKYLQTFLEALPERQQAVVLNLQVESSDDDPVDPLRALLATTVAPELIDLLCHSAVGQAKQAADRLIQRGEPSLLDGDTFKTTFRAFVQKNVMSGLLPSLSMPPYQGEVTTVLSSRPLFVRQLDLIGIPEEGQLRAISDFLRTSADKAEWAERGLIYEQSLGEWDDDLVRRHGFICGDIADRSGDHPAEARGRMTYRQCAMLQAPLEGRAVPGHFVHGCFNALADTLRIGWHPDATTLLKDAAP